MFAKKFLSVVSFLFMSSQLFSMARADCTITYTLGDTPGTDDTCVTSQNCDVGYYIVTGADENPKTPFTIGGSGDYKRYIKVTGVSADQTCVGIATAVSAAGRFSDATTFSIDGTNSLTLGDSNNYLFTDVDKVFTDSSSKKVVLKSTATAITMDTSFDGIDYCVDDNGEVFDRKSGLCKATIASGEDCTSYYDCTDGVCTPTTANKRSTGGSDVPDPSQCVPKDSTVTHCVNGYYITNDDGTALINDANNGKLWNCNGGNCEAKPSFIGYFVNKVTGKPQILCKVVNDVQQCNIVNIGYGSTCNTVGDLITSTQDGTDYQICLAASVAGIALSSYNSKQMMISIDKANGLYGIKPNTIASDSNTSFSLVIKVDGNNVQVVKETAPIRYRYIKTGSTDKMVYTRTAAKEDNSSGGICGTGSPFEYKLDQWTEALQTNDFAEFYVEGTNA